MRRTRWAGLILSIAATGSSALATADEPPRPEALGDEAVPAKLDFSGTGPALAGLARQERLGAIGRSPEHKAKRLREASAFQDLTGSEALDLVAQTYPEIVGAPAFDALPLAPGDKVLSSPSLYATRIMDASGDVQLVQTMLPTKAMQGDELKTADYSLYSTGASFRPRNPLVDTRIPKDFDEGIRFDHQGYGVRLSGASSTDEPKVIGDKVFYGNLVGGGLDALVTPTATGVETTLVVRSKDAPSESALQFQLDPSETLEPAVPDPIGRPSASGVRILRNGEPVAGVSAPIAYDAEGQSVPVSFRIEAAKMVLQMPRCGEAIACPYVVDPVIDNYQIDDNGTPSPTQTQDPFYYWQAFTSETGTANVAPTYQPANNFWVYRGYGGGFGNGLFIYSPTGGSPPRRGIANGTSAQWAWSAPGASFITRAVFGGLRSAPYYTCVVEGIYKRSSNFYDNGRWIDTAGGSGASPWYGTQSGGVGDSCGPQSNDTKIHTPTSQPTGGNEALFAAYSTASIPEYQQPTAFLYGAAMTLSDGEAPAISPEKTRTSYVRPGSGAGPLPSAWISSGTVSLEAEVFDPGLGVRDLTLSDVTGTGKISLSAKSAPIDRSQTTATSSGDANACTGGKDSRCPRVFNGTNGARIDIAATQIPEGSRNLRLETHDALGKASGDGHTTTVVEFGARVDRTAPSLRVDGPTGPVRGEVSVSGSATDLGAGVGSATVEVRAPGSLSWQPACTSPVDTPTGSFRCTWDTVASNSLDGVYSVRARASDAVSADYGGPNVGASAPVSLTVDNTAPSAPALSGPLQEEAGLAPAPGDYNLYAEAGDALSGVVRIAVTVDGQPLTVDGGNVYADTQNPVGVTTQPCAQGGCSLFADDIPYDTSEYSSAAHDVVVTAFDAAGNRTSTTLPLNANGPDRAPGTSPSFSPYNAGPSAGGLTFLNASRSSSPGDEYSPRQDEVTYSYGSCEQPADGGGCAPPLEVQSSPLCEAHLQLYMDGPAPPDYTERVIKGVPAAVYDGGRTVEVYTGNTTISIYADTVALADAAIAALAPAGSSDVPRVKQTLAVLDSPQSPVDQLPPPDQSTLASSVPC